MSSTDNKKANILICKIYILLQDLGPLPNDVCLTMKHFYCDKVTPPDYFFLVLRVVTLKE